MSSTLSKTFKIEVTEGIEYVSRAARRVIFNSDFLKSVKLCTGDIVAISRADDNGGRKKFAVGIVWPSLDLPADSLLLSTSFLLTVGLVAGQRARIFPLSGLAATRLPPGLPSLKHVQEAGTIRLREILTKDNGSKTSGPSPSSSKDQQNDWLCLALRELLVDLKYITNDQVIEYSYEGQLRRFAIHSTTCKTSAKTGSGEVNENLARELQSMKVDATPQLWSVSWDSIVTIQEEDLSITEDTSNKGDIEILEHKSLKEAYSSVGGLNKQIEAIRDLLEIPLSRPELFRYFGLKPPRGILLHGPPGTGKTHLARAIAASTSSSVLVINGPELSSAYHGETESKLRDVFRQAREKSPCIVVLDEVDALVPRREEGAGGEVEKRVVATLLTILDGMGDEEHDGHDRVVVIGTTNRPNAIDPALRRPGRFDREIEIGIPDTDARFAILNVLLSKTPHDISHDALYALSSRMHGYVGADISAVVREAGTIAIKSWLASGNSSSSIPDSLRLKLDDLVAAMPSIRPSAMRSLFIETPPIRYSDIGGQASVIQKLKETIEWPLLHPEAFQRLGVKPPKGVLLYGPPGCSKTVLARACAFESGVNFVAVKGPELLNKFVGESERAVREIFRKARAAAPSIIFFDEIDALATSRTSSDTDQGSSHEGVLTSLLNEMDGVQELNGVTVVAATNRPESIDSALMRPGRLDRILYVGPPDKEGREEILRIRMQTMTVGPDIDIRSIAELTEGCSGAEISSLCQEAAILTMQQDMNAPHVSQEAFIQAARTIKKQITPAVLMKFARWRDGNEVRTL